ncbi:hypothetical protein SAMN04488493_10743 [Xylanibacter ruminicola]|uniref:hypothetical protein n=1 Tax=Xylanibacter ruminicola TaxID=839 RepID=UPI0008F3C1E4|nr:hypothetical protein [Xylanibacter ruminicola]SFC44006.1 hypothetical protein SAMN04488493_10743 [Xylanibacter ruminicola]
MTQLLIAGVEVTLPQNFTVTVKRENSFFTKNGEYTYDCTLRLDNPINRTLYGFLQRLNKTDQLDTKRTAVLIADGHVYARGTEIITRWTQESVTIQIVSGESELNYFIGQDQKIEELDLGEIETTVTLISPTDSFPDVEFCLPTIRSQSGYVYNRYVRGHVMAGRRTGNTIIPGSDLRPQPYLCALLRRLMEALGYTVTENHLENTQFKNLFLVNTIFTTEYAKMLPGWTVKDFLTEVERLTGVVFITDNLNKTCAILLKTQFYANARQFTVRNVVDAYEAESQDDDSREAEFTTSDVSYDMPDGYWSKIVQLPEGYLEAADIEEFDFVNIDTAISDFKKVYKDRVTGRYYIKVSREYEVQQQNTTATDTFRIELNQYGNLDREDTDSTLELKIVPAPMAWLGMVGCEVVDIGTSDGYKSYGEESAQTEESTESEGAEGDIRSFEKKESAAIDLYCAFHNGSVLENNTPVAYTDAYHALIQALLYPMIVDAILGPEGSLRLKDLNDSYYQGGYEIDTRHAITFETYDPNVIDPRQVYVIRNRRYVVRDIEETITTEGRQKKWKLTCYPITITDTAIENRWVLTDGVWDDGGAWLDDGRWND